MVPFYAAPALQAPPPELVVYVKEQTLKKPLTFQQVTIDFPDGMRVRYTLANVSQWQKLAEPSRCMSPSQGITVTLLPRKEKVKHSALSFRMGCDEIQNNLMLSFAQNASGGLTVKQIQRPTEAMKKAALLKR